MPFLSHPDEVIAELMFADPSGGKPMVRFVRPSEVDWQRTEGRFHRMPMTIRNGRITFNPQTSDLKEITGTYVDLAANGKLGHLTVELAL